MAELDLMLNVPGVSAELDVIVGRAVQKAIMANADRAQLWRSLGAPVDKRIDVSVVVTAAEAAMGTPTVFRAFAPPKPQTGRLWCVRKVVVTGQTAGPFAAALANVTAAIFVTGQPVSALVNLGPPNQDAEQVNFTVPTTQFFATHQLMVRGQDSLVLGLQGSGLTSGLTFSGTARLTEIDDSAEFLLTL